MWKSHEIGRRRLVEKKFEKKSKSTRRLCRGASFRLCDRVRRDKKADSRGLCHHRFSIFEKFTPSRFHRHDTTHVLLWLRSIWRAKTHRQFWRKMFAGCIPGAEIKRWQDASKSFLILNMFMRLKNGAPSENICAAMTSRDRWSVKFQFGSWNHPVMWCKSHNAALKHEWALKPTPSERSPRVRSFHIDFDLINWENQLSAQPPSVDQMWSETFPMNHRSPSCISARNVIIMSAPHLELSLRGANAL